MSEREAIARIVDPAAWGRRSLYLGSMADSRDKRGGATSETIDGIADRIVEASMAKATAILALRAAPASPVAASDTGPGKPHEPNLNRMGEEPANSGEAR